MQRQALVGMRPPRMLGATMLALLVVVTVTGSALGHSPSFGDCRTGHWSDGCGHGHGQGPGSGSGSGPTQPPAPAPPPAIALSVAATDQTSVSLSWAVTPADGSIATFAVGQDSRPLGTTSATSFTVTGLRCYSTHRFDVSGLDASGNVASRAWIVASTAACAKDPNPPPHQPGGPPKPPTPPTPTPPTWLPRSLDGSANNPLHSDWGQAGTQYARLAAPNYADGIAAMQPGPSPRAISNLIFNDSGQNLFSENGISQWGWAWGQFIDHDMGLRDETPAESAPMPFDQSDPLESFTNDVGQIEFARTPAAPGTGVTTPRQQINTLSSYLDASQVYGTTAARLGWLRADSSADLLLPGGYLPRADARGNAAAAPSMDLMGALAGTPSKAVEAGDARANENIALTGLQTLFAREHNRIADALPAALGAELRFQIARRVVGAEIQWITYNEFLPTLGVRLAPYRGYDSHVDPAITNEFATVGFRAHSMVHGEFEPTVPAGTYSDALLAQFAAQGITIEHGADGSVTLVIPLAVAFGNPDLLQQVGLGPALESLDEHEYKNDEQIDNSMRSVLFQVPKPGVADPSSCGEPVVNPDCFSDVEDLGADDVQRGRDHGMPSYNQLRVAYGLPAVQSFTQITGETTDAMPAGMTCDDPASLAFTQLRDEHGNVLALGNQEDATYGVRASTLAARLKCLYGDVSKIDGFVGMVSERHIPGTEFGPLQLAMWKDQFTALRDGDRMFYASDPALQLIARQFGISYQHSLAEIVALNTGETLPANVFKAED